MPLPPAPHAQKLLKYGLVTLMAMAALETNHGLTGGWHCRLVQQRLHSERTFEKCYKPPRH